MLVTCDVGEELARRVGEDILVRAESFAALSQESQDVLIAPFAEEVAYYEPQSAPLPLRSAVAVVVRSSLLEEAHANGPVNAAGIKRRRSAVILNIRIAHGGRKTIAFTAVHARTPGS